MKIGIVYQSPFPPKKGASGADRRVRNIARGLVSQGHQIHLLTPRRNNIDILDTHPDGFVLHYLGTANKQTNWGKGIGRAKFWQEVCHFALTEKLSWLLLYSTTIDSLLPALYLRQSGIYIAAEFCDLRSSGFSLKKTKEIGRHLFFKLDEFFLPKATNLNIVISNYLFEFVTSKAPKVPAMKLPILVDVDRFVPDDAAASRFRTDWKLDQAPIIAYVGGLWRPEGVRYLVQAFAKVVHSYPKARLVIAGKLSQSSTHDDVVSLTKNLGLEHAVVTTGWIDTSEVIALLSASDILALPQTNHLFSQAALPTKLAEYSAMGKAIVATRVGDVPSYFRHGENAILCEPENINSLSNALALLINQPALRKKLGLAAKETAYSEFDYRHAGRIISKQMSEIMSSSQKK